MTSHYLEIRILPDPEFSQAHLMGALLSKLHRGLARLQCHEIGISFPSHVVKPASKRTLGNCVRLHGSAAVLHALMGTDWLKGMFDHVSIGSVNAVPARCAHRVVRRRQFKTSVDRLRRRRMQRKQESAEQAAQAIPASVAREPDLPYAHLRSLSTGQTFALFVEHGPLLVAPVSGPFNTYGLSQGGSVPWF
jgi:CRISPR-associated endonuclease Csy4